MEIDRGEPVTQIEPLIISESSRHRPHLDDLASELAMKAASFRSSLPPEIRSALADLVRAMNCYYSNLIEGHDTHPVDIERALQGDYSTDIEKRNLQLEARAHVTVQQWIDNDGLPGVAAVSREGLCSIHARFCQELPDDLLFVHAPGTQDKIRIVPGALRDRDVQVGRHVPISPGAVPRFLDHFERTFSRLGRHALIVSAAAAHHRLLWIHPFLDGNGRVARLMSHAILLNVLDTGGVWSVARGLARSSARYKAQLAAADAPRDSDLDGRGSMSERALAEFTRFFLEVCIDQVSFMEELVQPARLRTRVRGWAEEEASIGNLPANAANVLEAVLYRGALPRDEVAPLIGTGDRQARRVVAALTKFGVLTAKTSRSPLRLAFPAALASRWMPGLFPEP